MLMYLEGWEEMIWKDYYKHHPSPVHFSLKNLIWGKLAKFPIFLGGGEIIQVPV